MGERETVYDRTVRAYLDQLRDVSLEAAARTLGGVFQDRIVILPFFGEEYRVSVERITGPSGKQPTHDICVILCKYLLLCPETPPQKTDWVSFRDFKDSTPLITYFRHDVEHAIASAFSGKPDALNRASRVVGGEGPALEVSCDVAAQFQALPRIPVILLFRDADEEFAANCTVLFESRAESYLDAECLAMVGGQLSYRLQTCEKPLGPVQSFPGAADDEEGRV